MKVTRTMDGKFHIPVGFLSCLVVYIITYYFYGNGDTFALVVFGCFGSMMPDLDRFINRHRDFFTHSFFFPALSIIYMLGWNFGRYYDVYFFTLAVGFHLLFDLKAGKEGKMGTYCMVKPGFVLRKKKVKKNKPNDPPAQKKAVAGKVKQELGLDRMTVRNTDIWLSLNTAASFVACIVLYLLF